MPRWIERFGAGGGASSTPSAFLWVSTSTDLDRLSLQYLPAYRNPIPESPLTNRMASSTLSLLHLTRSAMDDSFALAPSSYTAMDRPEAIDLSHHLSHLAKSRIASPLKVRSPRTTRDGTDTDS